MRLALLLLVVSRVCSLAAAEESQKSIRGYGEMPPQAAAGTSSSLAARPPAPRNRPREEAERSRGVDAAIAAEGAAGSRRLELAREVADWHERRTRALETLLRLGGLLKDAIARSTEGGKKFDWKTFLESTGDRGRT